MTDIENKLRDTLHADAGAVPVPGDLTGRAVVRAGRIRRNRRIAAASGTAVVVLAAMLAVPLLLRPDPAPPPHQAATVGADPGLVSFDIDETAAGGLKSQIRSIDGLEAIRIYRRSDGAQLATFFAGADRAMIDDQQAMPDLELFRGDTPGPAEPVTINGQPGTIEAMARRGAVRTNWRIRWQPRPGMYLRMDVQTPDRARALVMTKAVRPDLTVPCQVPFKATFVPSGYRLTGCETYGRYGGQKWVSARAGAEFWVLGEKTSTQRAGFVPNVTVGGVPAQWDGGAKGRLVLADLHGMWTTVQGLSQADSFEVVRGLTVAADVSRKETWPR